MADKSYVEFLLGESWAVRSMVKKTSQMQFPVTILRGRDMRICRRILPETAVSPGQLMESSCGQDGESASLCQGGAHYKERQLNEGFPSGLHSATGFGHKSRERTISLEKVLIFPSHHSQAKTNSSSPGGDSQNTWEKPSTHLTASLG